MKVKKFKKEVKCFDYDLGLFGKLPRIYKRLRGENIVNMDKKNYYRIHDNETLRSTYFNSVRCIPNYMA